jgi:hypothetical protein
LRYFQPRLFLVLSLVFIAAVVIGTLSHESAHYLVARLLGYDARITYAYTLYRDPVYGPYFNRIFDTYNMEITLNQWFPGKEEFERLMHRANRHSFYITLGGPVQTMLTGTVGLLLLYCNRDRFRQATALNARQWTLIFLTLFWLRQTVNLVAWIGAYFVSGHFSTRGDEIRIASYLGLPLSSIAGTTAFIGAWISFDVLRLYIPAQQRLTFMAAAVTGGGLGYFLWLHWLGHLLLP